METVDVTDKILEGCKLAIKRLIEKKIKENGYLIVSHKGKVMKIKATDIHSLGQKP